MSAPLVVTTTDGTVWRRRPQERDGQALYAIEGAPSNCPSCVLATYAELEEHGIAGSADVLPMPVGPEPLALTEQQIEALAAAGDRVVNDTVHQDLCACDAWPKKCLSTGNYFMGAWDVSGLETALPAVLALWESMRGGELAALRARVAELEAERHSTNEALDDAVQALRARETDRSVDKLTRLLAPTQALREDEPAAEQPLIVYRADHPDSGIVLGHYSTAGTAREHCEALMRRDIPGASLDWIEDEEDGIAELVAAFGEDERPTGYIVTALEIASAYDEEADE